MYQYQVFDTETTGLFNFKIPADAPGQPRLVHAHFILTDSAGNPVSSRDFIVHPDETWSDEDYENLEAAAKAAHGLTREILEAKKAAGETVPLSDVLDFWEGLLDRGEIPVAYNSQYDTKVMRAELRRAGRDDRFDRTPNICVMWGLADAAGTNRMNLTRALALIGETLENAHTADADCEGARKVLKHLLDTGQCPEPIVRRPGQRVKGGAKQPPVGDLSKAPPKPASQTVGAQPAPASAPPAGVDFPDQF